MTDDLLGADQKIPDWLKIPLLERSTLQLNPGLLSWGQMTPPRACGSPPPPNRLGRKLEDSIFPAEDPSKC